jgi:hypothetical protein
MAIPAEKAAIPIPREGVDPIFLKIFEELGHAAIAGASACTTSIFALSASYMEKPAFETLRKFYDLYFAQGELQKQKDEVNAAVDDMVALLQEKMAAGEDIDINTEVHEDETVKRHRLSLSGVQKQLEGLIVLDAGIKEQILPALSSMQFEDAVRQRLQHVIAAWWKIGESINKDLSPEQVSGIAKEISSMLSSVEETRSFYEIVLNEKAPEGHFERSVFIEF